MILFIVICVSGCAANKYVVPETGPIANLTYLIKAESKRMEVFVYENYQCKKTSFIGSIGSDSLDREFTVPVRADRPFINTLRLHDVMATGYLAFEFSPKPGREYLVYVDTSELADLRVYERTKQGLKVDESRVEPKRVCRW